MHYLLTTYQIHSHTDANKSQTIYRIASALLLNFSVSYLCVQLSTATNGPNWELHSLTSRWFTQLVNCKSITILYLCKEKLVWLTTGWCCNNIFNLLSYPVLHFVDGPCALFSQPAVQRDRWCMSTSEDDLVFIKIMLQLVVFWTTAWTLCFTIPSLVSYRSKNLESVNISNQTQSTLGRKVCFSSCSLFLHFPHAHKWIQIIRLSSM